MRDDGDHSFGHGSSCYWCGLDGDDPAIEKPCDERERRKPSAAAMRHYDCTYSIESARSELEEAELVCDKNGYRDTAKVLYGLRLNMSEALRHMQSLRPSEPNGTEKP